MRVVTMPRSRTITSGGQKFYDSQSGSFITLPGSQGLRIHESRFRFASKSTNGNGSGPSDVSIIEHLRESSSQPFVSSVALPTMLSDVDFETYMSASIPYIHRNRSRISVNIVPQIMSTVQSDKLHKIAAQHTCAKELLEVETPLFVNKACLQSKDDGAFSIISSLTKFNFLGITTRVNVHVDVDSVVNNNKDDRLSIIEMGEVFARLCDLGVKVINISLISKHVQRPGGKCLYP